MAHGWGELERWGMGRAVHIFAGVINNGDLDQSQLDKLTIDVDPDMEFNWTDGALQQVRALSHCMLEACFCMYAENGCCSHARHHVMRSCTTLVCATGGAFTPAPALFDKVPGLRRWRWH
jgi:hypothetical protein